MTKLIVIDPIEATHEGPEVPVMGSDDLWCCTER